MIRQRMRNGNRVSVWTAGILGICALSPFLTQAADPPKIRLTMQFKPVHKDVEIDVPAEKDYPQCQVKVEREGKSSGWVVLGPGGQPIRRFVDTNGDNVVDQWRYYHNGVEVYRDIDSDYNNKVDQFRWFNHAGTRWGLDSNSDGQADSWKVLSPEEVSREAVQALVTQDAKRLQTLLITARDLKELGITGTYAERILEGGANPAAKLAQVASQSKVLQPQTKWMRFDGSLPSCVPADQVGSKADLMVYDNVMAIVDVGGQAGLIQIGELIRIGDVWKLTRVPQPIEGESPQIVASALLVPTFDNSATQAPSTIENPEMQKLVEDLQKIDQQAPAPTATKAQQVAFHRRRTDLLNQLRSTATSDEDKQQWTQQLVDGITAAVQTNTFPEGMDRLKQLQGELEKAKSPLAPYVTYRQLLAGYTVEMQSADSNDGRDKLQARWLKDLEGFVKTYPKAEDASDALLQLAMTQEFNGKFKEAQEWYSQLVRTHPDSGAAKRGTGALYRLDLKGKSLDFRGPLLNGGEISAAETRGKMVLLYFWATWCKPCTEELPQLRALYEQYHDRGFEIIGVNLDNELADIAPFLTEHKVNWPQIYEPGGMEGPQAQSFGIISLPTMILTDQNGKVVNRNISIGDLKTVLTDSIK